MEASRSLRLYELTDAYNNVREMLDGAEDDPELAESLTEALDVIEDDVTVKAGWIADIVNERKLEEEVLTDEITRLTRRREARRNDQKRLKDYLLWCLDGAGINRVKGALRTVRIQRNGGSLPIEFAPGAEPELLDRGYASTRLTVTVNTPADAGIVRRFIAENPDLEATLVETIDPHRDTIAAAIEAAREDANDDTVYPDDLVGLVTAERGRHVRVS